MKLFTHNMLTSNILKGVNNGFPLKIKASDVAIKEVDFNPEFIKRLIPKVEWSALRFAVTELNDNRIGDLPENVPESFEDDDQFLKAAHKALLEIEVMEGTLICPETGREFPITRGIPNMLINEDEH